MVTDRVLACSNVNILDYWRQSASTFPHLALMAREILQISAVGTIVERVFNFARQVCSPNRSNLSPEMIRCEMMVFCDQRAKHRTIEDELQQNRSQEGLYGLDEEDIAIEIKRQEEEVLQKLTFRFIPDSKSTHIITLKQTARNEERSHILYYRIKKRQKITQTLDRDPLEIAKRRAIYQDADTRSRETIGVYESYGDEPGSNDSDMIGNRNDNGIDDGNRLSQKWRLPSYSDNSGSEIDVTQDPNVNTDGAEVALPEQNLSSQSRFTSLKRLKRLPVRFTE